MEADIWFILGAIVAFGIGMGCGSYATMPYYRLPNNIVSAGRWIGKRSACPKCDTKLRTRDMIPIFNQVFNRGKCFSCGNKISRVYFMIELSVALTSVLLYLIHGFTEEYLVTFGTAICLVILGATDYTYRKIPKQVLVVMIIFGAIQMDIGVLFDQVHVFFFAIFCSLGTAALYEKMQGKDFPHYGYVQLFCLGALWMDWIEFIKYTAIVAVFILLIRLITKKGQDVSPPYAFAMIIGWYAFFLNLYDL